MVLDKRSLHLKLQEYCDCYMETDPKNELVRLSRRGVSADVTGDPEEAALKFLGLTILYGLKENARKISLTRSKQGESQLNVEAAGKYKLLSPPRALTDKIFEVMRSITHLEAEQAREPLALGIRNDRLELGVEFDAAGGSKTLTLAFPEV